MARDYKTTCLLPQTAFAMKADLAQREPGWLARWQRDGLYAQILARPSARKFVFHDGPPYANGHMHFGHALNNALKDFVTRFRNLAGEHTRFIPGWDCHGLPIELNVDKALGPKKREMTASQVRGLCEKEAAKWVGVQSEERQRLGVLGTWDAPYLTMQPGFESAIVQALQAFVERGIVYRGRKPVQWCAKDRTALAEAEVEYLEQHRSPSVYVKFPADAASAERLATLFDAKGLARCAALIWTTTPWTLPANLAIAVHPRERYVLLEVDTPAGREGWLVGAELVEHVRKATGVTGTVREGASGDVTGGAIARGGASALVFRHPWEDRDSPLLPADYVTMTDGTGLVHTAPGHGRDDYKTGLAFGLDAYAPLDDAGRFTDEAGEGSKAFGIVGKTVWEANPIIVDAMARRGVLANKPGETITHKYPGCWRCKNPLISRATVQWFIDLDKPMNALRGAAATSEPRSLRQRALEEIDRLAAAGAGSGTAAPAASSSNPEGAHAAAKAGGDATGWVPAWGRERIHGMIANRPDWCISRQRVWGVPIPALHCETCAHATLTPALLEHVSDLFARKGAGAWYDPDTDVVPPGFACEKCGSTGPFNRDQNILDVWFESGSSFWAVCREGKDLGVPVDLYLEGSDQHRGWFHSSLLVGIAVTDRAPFHAVVTHGFVFVVGKDGKPEFLSKSEIQKKREAGEDISVYDPNVAIKKFGGDVVRLWVASQDYRGDVSLSAQHFEQVTEGYRKVRNTFRFLLAALRNEPAPAAGELAPIDRWAVGELARVVSACEASYRAYDFRGVFAASLEFLNELSAFYLDATKDWLYNDAPDSPRRVSTLAAIDAIVRAMATVLAPLLPFTMEDVWDHYPRRADDPPSVHLTRWPTVEPPADGATLSTAVAAVRALRERVHGALEPLVQAWGVERQAAKKAGRAPGEGGERAFADEARIDHARDARAEVTAPQGELDAIAPLREVLAELLVLGDVALAAGDAPAVAVRKAPTSPCDRCWRRRPDVNSASGLCTRCADAVRIYDARGATTESSR